MRSYSLLLVLLLASLFYTHTSFSQIALSDKAAVSVLTCGPGNELYSVFGHTAIRVSDPEQGMDVVFNFGSFDFDTPNFYLKFVKGDLQYFVTAGAYQDFVGTYQYYNRDVYEQQLNLTQQQKQQIADELVTTLNSDKRFYTYKYFEHNCTTIVNDIVNKYIPKKISMKNSDEGKTYRRIVVEYLDNSFYENLGISLIFGYRTDREMERLFLPQQLLEGLSNTTTTAGPMAQPTVTVYKSTAQHEAPLWNNYYTYALACLLLMALSGNRVVLWSLLALLGLLGAFFCFVGFYSFHAEISQNYNALLVNPLFLVLLYFIFSNKYAAVKITATVCLVCMALYIIFMLNKPHIIIILPLAALVIILLLRVLFPRQRFLLKMRNK